MQRLSLAEARPVVDWSKAMNRAPPNLRYSIGALLSGACSLLLTAACDGPKHNRSVPVCAVLDCATGKILDDGCATDGKCKACANDCGQRVAPRAK